MPRVAVQFADWWTDRLSFTVMNTRLPRRVGGTSSGWSGGEQRERGHKQNMRGCERGDVENEMETDSQPASRGRGGGDVAGRERIGREMVSQIWGGPCVCSPIPSPSIDLCSRRSWLKSDLDQGDGPGPKNKLSQPAMKRRRLSGKQPMPADALVAEDSLVDEGVLLARPSGRYDFASSSDSGPESDGASDCSESGLDQDSAERSGSACDSEVGMDLGSEGDDAMDGGVFGGGTVELGDEPQVEPIRGALDWSPGHSVGQWVGRARSLEPQAQVLVLNAVTVLHRLPIDTVRLVLRDLGIDRGPGGTLPAYIRAAARLLSLSGSRLWRLHAAVSGRQWRPVGWDEPAPSSTSVAHKCDEREHQLAIMMVLVRTALAEAVSSASAHVFVQSISRLALSGVDVGGKYHTRVFARECQHLAAKVAQAQDRLELDRTLGGLGIASDFALLMDGVPVGGTNLFGRHGSVQVLCITAMSPANGRMHSRFLAWAVSARGHKGADMVCTVLDALAEPPVSLSESELRKRMSAIGGDGAVVRGGPDRGNPGTQAADLLWFRLHPWVAPPVADDDFLVDLARPRPVGGRPPGGAGGAGRPSGERDRWVHDACTLHAVTEWDKFHRQDIAMTRAIVKCPLAEEMYATCALMDHMFGLGDGRLLLKAAAVATGVDPRSGRLPGMTRKAVQLCSEPGHLLHNFRAYAAGMHLREAWRKEGHDASASKLIDAGRRLTAVTLVSFTLLFRDLLANAVAPWALVVQKSSVEPWVLQRQRLEHEAGLVVRWEVLQWLRHVLRIVVLLRQWVPTNTLRNLIAAFMFAKPRNLFRELDGRAASIAFGRCFPSWLSALPELILRSPPIFAGTELICTAEPWQADVKVLGPHCQCNFLRRRGTRHEAMMMIHGRRRRVRVPRWADGSALRAHHASGALEAERFPDDVVKQWQHPTPSPIRFQWHHTESLVVAAGVPPEGRFRARIVVSGGRRGEPVAHTSSCVLPQLLPQTFVELDSSAAAACGFIATLLHEERRLFGAEGVNAGLAAAHTAMSRCFDWGRLVSAVPTVADLAAVASLNTALRPYLLKTDFPSETEFPGVVRGWPDNPTLQTQYVVLMNRIRGAPRRCPRATRGWWRSTGYRVEPVLAVESLWKNLVLILYRAAGCPTGTSNNLFLSFCSRICSVMQTFLMEPDTLVVKGTPGPFVVSPAALARCGVPWRGRRGGSARRSVASGEWDARKAEPAGLAVLRLPGVTGKLVYIREHIKELDWSAVSGSIDCDPYFSRGGVDGARLAWHAARLHHRCRTMGPPEACCERVGSLMKWVWGKNNRLSVSTLMDIVGLIAADVRCSGTDRDEALCRAVAEAFLDAGRMPDVGHKYRQRRAEAGIVVSRSVARFRQDATAAMRAAGRGDALDAEEIFDDGGIDLEGGTAQTLLHTRARAAGRALHSMSDGVMQSARRGLRKAKPGMVLPIGSAGFWRVLLPTHGW